MLKKLMGIFFVIVLLTQYGCNEQKKPESVVEDITGVWKAESEDTLMTIVYANHQAKILLGDTFMPMTLGDVDAVNGTVNFNGVIAATGKPAVWTVRQVWNHDKTSFTLKLTMHDGTQEDFGFVRKVSTDDLNRIASLETPANPGAGVSAVAAQTVAPASAPITTVVATSTEPAQPLKVAVPEAPAASTPTEATQPAASTNTVAPAPGEVQSAIQSSTGSPTPAGSFAPSFDCAKVSNGPERLICNSQELSQLDVELGQAYKSLMEVTAESDKAETKREQIEWRRRDRDACSTADCVAKAYQDRIAELNTVDMHLRKPAEFK